MWNFLTCVTLIVFLFFEVAVFVCTLILNYLVHRNSRLSNARLFLETCVTTAITFALLYMANEIYFNHLAVGYKNFFYAIALLTTSAVVFYARFEYFVSKLIQIFFSPKEYLK